MKLTPLTARKALLDACVKQRSGSKTVAVQASVLFDVVELLGELELEINGLRNPGLASYRERLEDKINQANNAFGHGAWLDGLNQTHLDKLVAELHALPRA